MSIDNILLKACTNDDITFMKIISSLELDANDFNQWRDWNGNTYLGLICTYNKHFNIIRYLVEELKMDILAKNYCCTSIFMSVCRSNTLENIKYIVNKIIQINKNELYSINNVGSDASVLACGHNTLDVVKYLVDELNFTCDVETNGFLTACAYSEFPEVIRYLINELHIDINSKNRYEHNGFYLASYKNPNVSIVKCLVEEFNFNTNIDLEYDDNELCSKNNKSRVSLMERVFDYNKSDDVVRYLVDNTNQILSIFRCESIYVENRYLKRLKKMNHPIIKLYDGNILNIIRTYEYIIDNKKYILLSYHPFVNLKTYVDILDYDSLVKICKYKQINNISCNDIINDVMKIDDHNISLFKTPFNDQLINLNIKNLHSDFTITCEFDKNQIIHYYCSGWWICNVIPLFNKMLEFGGIESKKGITLKLNCPKKIFYIYLMSCCTGTLKISDLNIIDMLHFVTLQDMYPNVMFNINDLEPYIITKLDLDEDHISEVFSICDRFKSKKLLIAQHNKIYKDTIKDI